MSVLREIDFMFSQCCQGLACCYLDAIAQLRLDHHRGDIAGDTHIDQPLRQLAGRGGDLAVTGQEHILPTSVGGMKKIPVRNGKLRIEFKLFMHVIAPVLSNSDIQTGA